MNKKCLFLSHKINFIFAVCVDKYIESTNIISKIHKNLSKSEAIRLVEELTRKKTRLFYQGSQCNFNNKYQIN